MVPSKQALISETFKLSLPVDSLVNDLRALVQSHLAASNDGNKLYHIRAFAATGHSDAQTLPLNRLVSTYFPEETSNDIYCHLDIEVDAKKHVKPVEVREPAKKEVQTQIISDAKYVTMAKYSYYESGSKWVKVLLDFKGINAHPKDKVTVEFKPRSFTLQVMDFKAQNYQFQVPKLQCYIVPEECSFTIKSDSIQVTLRKAKDDDNWWSLFRTKAVGEVLSD